MNRPPLAMDVLELPVFWNWYRDNEDCLQEALTAEWLIEQGLMPDPVEILIYGYELHPFSEETRKFTRKDVVWVLEDKTK